MFVHNIVQTQTNDSPRPRMSPFSAAACGGRSPIPQYPMSRKCPLRGHFGDIRGHFRGKWDMHNAARFPAIEVFTPENAHFDDPPHKKTPPPGGVVGQSGTCTPFSHQKRSFHAATRTGKSTARRKNQRARGGEGEKKPMLLYLPVSPSPCLPLSPSDFPSRLRGKSSRLGRDSKDDNAPCYFYDSTPLNGRT
jgi:hypothetical protein